MSAAPLPTLRLAPLIAASTTYGLLWALLGALERFRWERQVLGAPPLYARYTTSGLLYRCNAPWSSLGAIWRYSISGFLPALSSLAVLLCRPAPSSSHLQALITMLSLLTSSSLLFSYILALLLFFHSYHSHCQQHLQACIKTQQSTKTSSPLCSLCCAALLLILTLCYNL